MRVREIIEMLEDLDPNLEVRFASQPNYPLEYSIEDIVIIQSETKKVVYLSEGYQYGYLPSIVKEELGW